MAPSFFERPLPLPAEVRGAATVPPGYQAQQAQNARAASAPGWVRDPGHALGSLQLETRSIRAARPSYAVVCMGALDRPERMLGADRFVTARLRSVCGMSAGLDRLIRRHFLRRLQEIRDVSFSRRGELSTSRRRRRFRPRPGRRLGRHARSVRQHHRQSGHARDRLAVAKRVDLRHLHDEDLHPSYTNKRTRFCLFQGEISRVDLYLERQQVGSSSWDRRSVGDRKRRRVARGRHPSLGQRQALGLSRGHPRQRNAPRPLQARLAPDVAPRALRPS